jgi:hypothetical protein
LARREALQRHLVEHLSDEQHPALREERDRGVARAGVVAQRAVEPGSRRRRLAPGGQEGGVLAPRDVEALDQAASAPVAS